MVAGRRDHPGRPWGGLSKERVHASPFEGHHCFLASQLVLQGLIRLQ